MNSFKLRILACDRAFYEGECESLIIPAYDGQYGIMAGHSDMAAALFAGELTFRPAGGQNITAAVSDGMMKIEGGNVLLLVESAEYPEEIDAARAKNAAMAAEEAMRNKQNKQEHLGSEADLARAIARLRVKGRQRNTPTLDE